MANFFEPGNAKNTTTATPSEANQATQKFKALLLGHFLDAMGSSAPTFASFVKGGPAQRPGVSGYGGDITSLLDAMNQPGAFTSKATGTMQPPTPSGMNDLAQGLGLLGLITQLHPIDQLQALIHSIGGGNSSAGSGQQLDMNQTPSNAAGYQSLFGGGTTPDASSLLSILGAGDPSLLGPGYGVLQDTSSFGY